MILYIKINKIFISLVNELLLNSIYNVMLYGNCFNTGTLCLNIHFITVLVKHSELITFLPFVHVIEQSFFYLLYFYDFYLGK